MKPEFNKKYTTVAVYAFLVIAAALCFWAILHNITAVGSGLMKVAQVFSPFITGFIIAYLMNPVVKMCEKWYPFIKSKKQDKDSKFRRILAIITAYIIVLGFIALFVILIFPKIVESIRMFATQITVWAPQAVEKIQNLIDNTEYELYVTDFFNRLVNRIVNLAFSYTGDSLAAVYFGVKNVAMGIINFIFGFVISLYMLYDKEKFIRQGKMLVSAFSKADTSVKIIDIAKDAHEIFSGFIGAKIITSLILGVLCTLSMWVLQLPYAPLIGFIIGLTNLIPYFGTWIGGAVCAMIIMVVSPLRALWFVVLILILQQIDNSIISPKVLGDSTGISPFWTIFAILVGGGFFGIPGMLIGVPVFALIYSLFAAYVREKSK